MISLFKMPLDEGTATNISIAALTPMDFEDGIEESNAIVSSFGLALDVPPTNENDHQKDESNAMQNDMGINTQRIETSSESV